MLRKAKTRSLVASDGFNGRDRRRVTDPSHLDTFHASMFGVRCEHGRVELLVAMGSEPALDEAGDDDGVGCADDSGEERQPRFLHFRRDKVRASPVEKRRKRFFEGHLGERGYLRGFPRDWRLQAYHLGEPSACGAEACRLYLIAPAPANDVSRDDRCDGANTLLKEMLDKTVLAKSFSNTLDSQNTRRLKSNLRLGSEPSIESNDVELCEDELACHAVMVRHLRLSKCIARESQRLPQCHHHRQHRKLATMKTKYWHPDPQCQHHRKTPLSGIDGN
eukprot:988892-Rhodomonas_salina.7